MNLSKITEFFDPSTCTERVHIIGCGSVGSTIAENLVRCGIQKLTLWDFDDVVPHNIVNQMFFERQIGMKKVEALKEILVGINGEAESKIKIKPNGWNGEVLSGYIFLCVDNIDLRRKIVEDNMNTAFIKAIFDVRTELTGAQHYAADWSSVRQRENLLSTMQFSHEEASSNEHVSACGVTLGVATTVRLVSAIAVNNFLNFVKSGKIWKFSIFDGFKGTYDCV